MLTKCKRYRGLYLSRMWLYLIRGLQQPSGTGLQGTHKR